MGADAGDARRGRRHAATAEQITRSRNRAGTDTLPTALILHVAREERALAVDGYEELSKAELLETIRRDWAEWEGLVARAADRIEEPGVEGDWSVKDVIAHILVYERWQAGLLGEPVRALPAPPPGVNLADTDQRNAWFHALDRDRSLAEVRAEAAAVHQQVLALIEARSEDELRTVYTLDAQGHLAPAAGTPAGRQPRWPLWRWFVSNTFDHYRQHIPHPRAWLDATGGREAGGQASRPATEQGTRVLPVMLW